MFCDQCGSPLNQQGVCPVCGWSKDPNMQNGVSSAALNPNVEPVNVSVFNSAQEATPQASHVQQQLQQQRPMGQQPMQQGIPQGMNPNMQQGMQRPMGQQSMPQGMNPNMQQGMQRPMGQQPMQQGLPQGMNPNMQQGMQRPMGQQPMQQSMQQGTNPNMQQGMNPNMQQGMQRPMGQQPMQQSMQQGMNPNMQQGMQNMYGMQQQGMAGMGQAYGYNQNRPSSPSKPPKKKWPLILGISLAVIAIIVIIVLILNKDDVTDYTSTETTTELTTTEAIISTTEAPNLPPQNAEAGSKTIMIYMVGSNLESQYEAATEDIQEMLDSGYDESNTTILIHTGGCTDWKMSEIPDRKNATLVIQNRQLVKLEEESAKNMGDSNTLSDFLNYGYDNYPAEQYGLILWNHGGGAFFGFGHDEMTDDSLTLQELCNAFNNSRFTSSNPFEFIGFDACLMGNIETAHALAPYTHYLIASQEPEPGWGWDYSFLRDIGTMKDGAEIGTEAVDCFISTTSSNFTTNPFSYSSITLSVLDLTKIDPVETALSDLFEKANGELNAGTFAEYAKVRTTSKEVAAAYSYCDESYDVIDMVDLAKRMNSKFPTESMALANALSDLIVYSDANEANENGVSVYFPYYGKEYADYYLPIYNSFHFADGYTAFITNFAGLLTGTNTFDVEWNPSALQPTMNGDMSFSVQLSDEQVSNLSNSYFVISRADQEQPGNYVCVALNNDVTVDGTNKATANFNGDIIYMKNDTTGDLMEVMYQVQETTDTYTRYLLTSILYNDDIQGEDAVYAYFVMEIDAAHPQGQLLGAYPIANYVNSNGNELFPERYELDLDDFENVAFGNLSHYFTSDEDLTEFNEADWADLTINYNSLPISDGFSTVLGAIQPGMPYYGMFVFEDLQGERHSSSLVQIQ